MIRRLFPVLLLISAGCGTGEESTPPPTGKALPQRIVSLIPSATLTLQALGAGDLLVGRTDYDTASALAHLPSVGGGINPSLEALVALEPDLVIRFQGQSDPTTVARLDDLGIPHLALRPDGIQDVRRSIRTLGEITGRDGKADSILSHMDRTFAEIRDRVKNRPPVRVAYLLGGTPPWAAGPDTYIGQLLEAAGGVNVFSDLEGLYGPISREQLLAREIDLVLAPEGGEVSLPTDDLTLRRVSPALELPGPHLAESARELAALIHPEAFR